MVLSDKEIRSGEFVTITPFEESLLNPNSYDIRITGLLLEVNPTGEVIDFENKVNVCTRRINIGKKGFILKPNRTYLAAITSHTDLHNCACQVMAKSSSGRIGLTVCQDAGWCEVGFSGYLTLEIKVTYPTLIKAGARVGQLVFYKTGEVELPYDKRPTSKYRDQGCEPRKAE